jgi:hypothetical protein
MVNATVVSDPGIGANWNHRKEAVPALVQADMPIETMLGIDHVNWKVDKAGVSGQFDFIPWGPEHDRASGSAWMI